MKTKTSLTIPSTMPFRQRGVSLVEIMVALLLSLVLLVGVEQIYVGSKQTYRMQDGQSRLQENARYALDVLNRDIRLAGYFGCHPLDPKKFAVIANPPLVAPNPDPTKMPLDLPDDVVSAPITSGGENNEGAWDISAKVWNPSGRVSPALSSPLDEDVVKGTDAITVQFAESCNGIVTTFINTVDVDPASLVAGNTCGTLSAGTPLVIANCRNTIIFKADTGSALNTSNEAPTNLLNHYSFGPGSELMLYRSYTYYIRLNPNNEPALYRFDNGRAAGSNNPVEVVEGIENMQILYGVDSDNDGAPNQFLSALEVGAVANWARVVNVQVALTVRSVGENADNLSNLPNTRPFNGNAKYTDHRLLRTFTATINLRNRQL